MMNSTRNIQASFGAQVLSNCNEVFAELISGPGLASGRDGAAVCCVFHIGRRFACRGNIFRASALKNVLAAVHFFGGIAVHGYENSALLQTALVALGFKFRDAPTYERAGNSADRATNSDAR